MGFGMDKLQQWGVGWGCERDGGVGLEPSGRRVATGFQNNGKPVGVFGGVTWYFRGVFLSVHIGFLVFQCGDVSRGVLWFKWVFLGTFFRVFLYIFGGFLGGWRVAFGTKCGFLVRSWFFF